MNKKKLGIFSLLILLRVFVCAEPLLHLQSNYEADYKNKNIKSTLSEGAKLSTDIINASIYLKQTPDNQENNFFDSARYGIEAKVKNISIGNTEISAKASALNLHYAGLISRLKNREKLLTSSSPLQTALNAPRGTNAYIPVISNANSKNTSKSAYFQTSIESDNSTTYADFILIDDEKNNDKKDFVACISESVLFGQLLSSIQLATYKEENTIYDTSIALSGNHFNIVSALDTSLDTVKDTVNKKKEICITSTSAATMFINTHLLGDFAIQGGYFLGNEKSEIKNMQSYALIYDFFNNRVRIGTRVIRTEKQDEDTTKYLLGLRYHKENLSLSLILTDVQKKQSVAFFASNKVNTIRLSTSLRAAYNRDNDTFTTSVRTGIKAEECIFAQWKLGASLDSKDGEIQKRTADTGISFSLGSTIRWTGKILFNVSF